MRLPSFAIQSNKSRLRSRLLTVNLLSLGLLAVASAGPLSERIFFVASPGGITKIYVIRPDGRDYSRLTHDLGQEHDPSVSPAGRAVAFRSNHDGFDEIYRCNLAGEEFTRLTFDRGLDRQPSWSPDGKWLVFATSRYGEEELAVMNATTGEKSDLRRLTRHNAQCSCPAWSPRGDWIAYSGYQQGRANIYLIAPDGTRERRVTDDRQPDVTPSWSPDGQRLVFQTQRGPRDIPVLALYDLATNKTEVISTITDHPGPTTTGITELAYYPTWSPDGHSILYLGAGTRRVPKARQYQIFDLSSRQSHLLPPPPTVSNTTFNGAAECDWSIYPFPWESSISE